jgi:hypothetical protein
MFSFFRKKAKSNQANSKHDIKQPLIEPNSTQSEAVHTTDDVEDEDLANLGIINIIDAFTVENRNSLYMYDVDINYIADFFEMYDDIIQLPIAYCHIDNIDRFFIPDIRNKIRVLSANDRYTICHLIGYMIGIYPHITIFHTVLAMLSNNTRYFMKWTISPRRMCSVIVVEYVESILSRFLDDYLYDDKDTNEYPIPTHVPISKNPNGYILHIVCPNIETNKTLIDTTEAYLQQQMHERSLSLCIDYGPRLILINDTNHLSYDFYKKKGYIFDAQLFKCTHCCFFKVIE